MPLRALLLLLVGCPGTVQPPPNARACSSDYDCADEEHCGFYAPDTRPVCLPGPPGPPSPLPESRRDGGRDTMP